MSGHASGYNPRVMRPARRSLALALAASVALHAIALVLIHIPDGEATSAEDAPIEVALAPPEPAPAPPSAPRAAAPAALPPRQMVAPPDVINDRAPDNARFESDRDNTVLKETVAPGVPHPAPAAAPPPRQQPPPSRADAARARTAARDAADEEPAPRPKEARRDRAPALDDLFAPTDELVRAQREADDRAAEQAAKADDAQHGAGTGRRRLAIAVPPVIPEWSLPGKRGTFDYLPDIQRGDVTLLNTKANTFAPFVRRVGERVFQHLVIRQRSLEIQQILSAHDVVEMRVTLDRGGKLKTVRIETHSGSASMDDTLSEAVNTAAFDNNPPPAAANPAGEYEFVFAAQLRTFAPGQGNVPSRIESRLSVGLL